MKVVIVPSGFKECLNAEEVALAMERGVRRFNSSIDTVMIPMVDGGEGFVKTIISLKDGDLIYKKVTGPVGKKISSYFGLYEENGKRIAVIEMAAVAGLRLVPHNQRNPLHTTTYGVGELILAALDFEVDHILIGCGDSGTSDGGAGMAQALGVQFLNKKGNIVPIEGGEDLLKANSLLTTKIDKRLKHISIDVACNWKNVLCGEKGVARVFGPQKGATSKQVEILSSALEHYASLIEVDTGLNVRSLPGSGASGGLGAGLLAFTNAVLHPRFDLIMNFITCFTRRFSALSRNSTFPSTCRSVKLLAQLAQSQKFSICCVLVCVVLCRKTKKSASIQAHQRFGTLRIGTLRDHESVALPVSLDVHLPCKVARNRKLPNSVQ